MPLLHAPLPAPFLALAQAAPTGGGDATTAVMEWLDSANAALSPYIETTKLPVLLLTLAFAALMVVYQRRLQRGGVIDIRRIPGLDAIDEAIGRSTEMGRPVLYVPGTDEIKEIQTIYSMMILRHVARKTAEFGTELIVPVKDSIVLAFAEEAVKAGCMDAGRPDAFVKDNVRYLSNEQFAYCAGIAGIMTREKPAANLLMGMFYAESLILAETGFLSGAIQVAGTAKQYQLPFFVAACDYTIMGEEYYAVTAYLTREPNLVGTIRTADVVKFVAIGLVIVGLVLATVHVAGHPPGEAIPPGWADVLRRLLGAGATGGGGE